MKKLLVIMMLASMLVLAGCGSKKMADKGQDHGQKDDMKEMPAEQPSVEASDSELLEEMDTLEDEDFSEEDFNDFDAALDDIESLDI